MVKIQNTMPMSVISADIIQNHLKPVCCLCTPKQNAHLPDTVCSQKNRLYRMSGCLHRTVEGRVWDWPLMSFRGRRKECVDCHSESPPAAVIQSGDKAAENLQRKHWECSFRLVASRMPKNVSTLYISMF